MVVVSLKD